MKKEDKIDLVVEMAEISNYQLHGDLLMIPVLKGLEIREIPDNQVILFADKDNLCEQLISDGHVEEEDIEGRIENIIDSTKEYMKEVGCRELKNNFLFSKEYKTDNFQFKVYVEDIVFEDQEEMIIRQMNAYFYEKEMEDMYQLSLSSGPYLLKDTSIKIGTIDLENDLITKELDKKLTLIMKNLKYNKKEEI